MNPTTFVERLRAEVPEATRLVDDHLETYDEVLLHVLVADLGRWLRRRFDRGDAEVAHQVLALLEQALANGDDDVANAVAVSFVEGTDLEDRPFIDAWPPGLRAESRRQQAWEP